MEDSRDKMKSDRAEMPGTQTNKNNQVNTHLPSGGESKDIKFRMKSLILAQDER